MKHKLFKNISICGTFFLLLLRFGRTWGTFFCEDFMREGKTHHPWVLSSFSSCHGVFCMNSHCWKPLLLHEFPKTLFLDECVKFLSISTFLSNTDGLLHPDTSGTESTGNAQGGRVMLSSVMDLCSSSDRELNHFVLWKLRCKRQQPYRPGNFFGEMQPQDREVCAESIQRAESYLCNACTIPKQKLNSFQFLFLVSNAYSFEFPIPSSFTNVFFSKHFFFPTLKSPVFSTEKSSHLHIRSDSGGGEQLIVGDITLVVQKSGEAITSWGLVVEIPFFFTRFCIFQVVGNGITEPSTVSPGS